MCHDNRPSFSHIVCSSPPVQTAFVHHGSTRFWWRLILRLHGKPVSPTLSPEERIRRIAEGFRFYAGLYRLLAVLFLVLAPTLLTINALGDGASSYWAAACLLAGIYLWAVSGLGYAGARTYGSGQGTASVVAFMVMIVAFLSMFVAVASVLVHHAGRMGNMPNILGASALFAFGVGSYMIEIIYLATERP